MGEGTLQTEADCHQSWACGSSAKARTSQGLLSPASFLKVQLLIKPCALGEFDEAESHVTGVDEFCSPR